MYIDIKQTVWERIYFDDEIVNTDEIIEILNSPMNLPCDVIRDEFGFYESEMLYDTTEYMDLTENNGASTIEVYASNDDLIWSNGRS